MGSKSMQRQLAEAYAISAANTARRHPDDQRMQQVARDLARKARDTK